MSHKALFKGRRFERDGTLSNSSSGPNQFREHPYGPMTPIMKVIPKNKILLKLKNY